MKRRIYIPMLAVILCLTLSVGSAALVSEQTPASAPLAGAVSDAVDVMAAVGTVIGPNSSHGGNQNRVVTVSSGTYLGVMTAKEPLDDLVEMSLIRVSPDGGATLLYKDYIAGGSATVSIMADADENIWLYSGWEDENSSVVMKLWLYDVASDSVTVYEDTQVPLRGNSYGYSVAFLDTATGCIYASRGGGGKPGWFGWNVFDLSTREWGPFRVIKTSARMTYHYGFSDGAGGIFFVVQRTPENGAITCDLGISVSQAIKQYHSYCVDANYTWDELYILHIPDPAVQEFTAIPVETAEYNVKDGMYVTTNHAYGDCYVDTAGRLHILYYTIDNHGVKGRYEILKTYDIVDGFRELGSSHMTFVYGYDHIYDHRFYEDTAGKLYIVAAPQAHDISVEIWNATDELGLSFRLADTFTFPSLLDDAGDAIRLSRLVIANRRNHSVPSDTSSLILQAAGTWSFFTVNFSALQVNREVEP